MEDQTEGIGNLEKATNAIKIIVETTPIILGALAILVFIVTAPSTIKNPITQQTSNSTSNFTANFRMYFQTTTFYNSLSAIFVVVLILILASIFSFSLSYLHYSGKRIFYLCVSLLASLSAILIGVVYSSFFLSNFILRYGFIVVTTVFLEWLLFAISDNILVGYDKRFFLDEAVMLLMILIVLVSWIYFSAMPI